MNAILAQIVERLKEEKDKLPCNDPARMGYHGAIGIVQAVFANAEQGSDVLRLEAYEVRYEVYLDRSNKYLGDLVCGDDGEWQFGPGQGRGYWPAWLVRAIVAELEKLNSKGEEACLKN